jgi:hypothetical protein
MHTSIPMFTIYVNTTGSASQATGKITSQKTDESSKEVEKSWMSLITKINWHNESNEIISTDGVRFPGQAQILSSPSSPNLESDLYLWHLQG